MAHNIDLHNLDLQRHEDARVFHEYEKTQAFAAQQDSHPATPFVWLGVAVFTILFWSMVIKLFLI